MLGEIGLVVSPFCYRGGGGAARQGRRRSDDQGQCIRFMKNKTKKLAPVLIKGRTEGDRCQVSPWYEEDKESFGHLSRCLVNGDV